MICYGKASLEIRLLRLVLLYGGNAQRLGNSLPPLLMICWIRVLANTMILTGSSFGDLKGHHRDPYSFGLWHRDGWRQRRCCGNDKFWILLYAKFAAGIRNQPSMPSEIVLYRPRYGVGCYRKRGNGTYGGRTTPFVDQTKFDYTSELCRSR